jgi:hypothetical protein
VKCAFNLAPKKVKKNIKKNLLNRFYGVNSLLEFYIQTKPIITTGLFYFKLHFVLFGVFAKSIF